MRDQFLDPHLHIWKPGPPKFQLQSFLYSWRPPHLHSVTVSASSTSWLSQRNRDVLGHLCGLGQTRTGKEKGQQRGKDLWHASHATTRAKTGFPCAKSPPCLNHFFTQLDHVTPHCISSMCKHGGKHSCWTEECSCGILPCPGLAASGVAGSFSITPFTGEHCCLAVPLFPMYGTGAEL